MGASALGRLLDPAVLDAAPGARARLCIQVPPSWLAEGADLRFTAPRRLSCARCGAGGCDDCARSGALRAPEDASLRTLSARLPEASPCPVALRIAQPFGPESPIDQLLIEIHGADAPSPGVARVVSPPPLAYPAAPLPWPAIAAAILAAASVLIALLSR